MFWEYSIKIVMMVIFYTSKGLCVKNEDADDALKTGWYWYDKDGGDTGGDENGLQQFECFERKKKVDTSWNYSSLVTLCSTVYGFSRFRIACSVPVKSWIIQTYCLMNKQRWKFVS
jgi:hypothetical protein